MTLYFASYSCREWWKTNEFLNDLTVAKNLPANTGDIRGMGLIPRSGRSPGGGYDNPLQYSCLENPMDRGAWLSTVHGVTKSQTQLTFSMYSKKYEIRSYRGFDLHFPDD